MSADFLSRLADRALGMGSFVTPNRSPVLVARTRSAEIEANEVVEVPSHPAPPDMRVSVESRTQVRHAPDQRIEPSAEPRIQAHEPEQQPAVAAKPIPMSQPSSPDPHPATAMSVDSPNATEAGPLLLPRGRATPAQSAENVRRATVEKTVQQPLPGRVGNRVETQPPIALPMDLRPRSERKAESHVGRPIQVTIGEVVVRLIEEKKPQPALARPTPSRPATLSLDDYLRSRDGRTG